MISWLKLGWLNISLTALVIPKCAAKCKPVHGSLVKSSPEMAPLFFTKAQHASVLPLLCNIAKASCIKPKDAVRSSGGLVVEVPQLVYFRKVPVQGFKQLQTEHF